MQAGRSSLWCSSKAPNLGLGCMTLLRDCVGSMHLAAAGLMQVLECVACRTTYSMMHLDVLAAIARAVTVSL